MLTGECNSQGFQFNGQISSWGIGFRYHNEWDGKFGIRYIPQFNYNYIVNQNDVINAEVLFNTYYETDFNSSEKKIDPYRAILRYSTTQSEFQFGLQKINFGSAQLLRPLMWFDRIDPRDPLKITDGVYALRYKYSFLNNSVFWLWILYGNNDTKGFELLPTEKENPEFGARIQLPFLEGEIGATFHSRRVDATIYNYRENRYALDGRWDIGIGIWFESVLQHSISKLTNYKWNRMTTIGADYTIPEGNGIYILAEHMTTAFSKSFWDTDLSRQISAMMITHSISVIDNLILQEFYDWDNKNLYQYFQFQRTYDKFIINFALFHYPEDGEKIFLNGRYSLLSGYGSQLMLIFNY